MTPTEAAALVTGVLSPTWSGRTFAIGTIHQDDVVFAVTYGNAEYLTGGDPTAMLLGAPIAVVDKATREVSFVPYLADVARFDAMTPVTAPA